MHIKDITLLIVFIIVGVLTRTVFHIAPNVEFVTGVSLAGGYFLTNKKLAILVPILILFFTDLIIGNTIIYLFTWSGFLISPIVGFGLKKIQKKGASKLIIKSEVAGLVSTLIFFFWTNFGVVLTTNMYAKNLSGVMHSYINALPFLRNQVLGNLVIIPIIFIGTLVFLNFKSREKRSKSTLRAAEKIYN